MNIPCRKLIFSFSRHNIVSQKYECKQYIFATRDAFRTHSYDIHASNLTCFIAISPLSNLSSERKAPTANFIRPERFWASQLILVAPVNTQSSKTLFLCSLQYQMCHSYSALYAVIFHIRIKRKETTSSFVSLKPFLYGIFCKHLKFIFAN